MPVYKPHSNSSVSTSSYSKYSVATGFTPIGESTQNVPPNLETEQDNRTPPKPEVETENTDVGGVIPFPQTPRYLVVCHALLSKVGKSIVVAATCGVRGDYNVIIPVGAVSNVLEGVMEVSLNKKQPPETTPESYYLTNPNIQIFENLVFLPDSWSVVESNGGANGEHEYNAGTPMQVNYYYFESAMPSTVLAAYTYGDEVTLIRSFDLGVREAGRTEGYNVCLALGGTGGTFESSYHNKKLLRKKGTGFINGLRYFVEQIHLVEESGTRVYEGICRDENGDPIHECYVKLDSESSDGEEIKESFTFAFTEIGSSFSFYHIYINYLGVIEYIGSVWVTDPFVPIGLVSKDDKGGIEVVIQTSEKEFIKTNYVNPFYPANADFTNSFNAVTITKPEATQTLNFPANVVNVRANTDGSISDYYGLNELSYNAIIIGAASLV